MDDIERNNVKSIKDVLEIADDDSKEKATVESGESLAESAK